MEWLIKAQRRLFLCDANGFPLAIREAGPEQEGVASLAGLRKNDVKILLKKQEGYTRTMANQMKFGAPWEHRRDAYPSLLRLCVQGLDGWK